MKLTSMQRTRLSEIARGDCTHAGIMKATTARLEELGFVAVTGRDVAKSGKVMRQGYASITEAGRAALQAARGGQ